MQFLVVDVGNTSTAVGLWSSGHVRCVAHCDEGFNQASLVAQELVQKKGFRLSGLAYLSVVPRQNARWKRWAHALKMPFLPITSRLFTEHVYSDLTLDYPHPETIGCDRLADAAAALDRYGAPVLVCDFGTAWTSAVMTSDGVWRGGGDCAWFSAHARLSF